LISVATRVNSVPDVQEKGMTVNVMPFFHG
jgi:hypothetical protein